MSQCFSLFIFEVDLYERSKTGNVCLLFLELTLDTKEDTANERSHSHIFIKFIKKKNSEIAYVNKWVKPV